MLGKLSRKRGRDAQAAVTGLDPRHLTRLQRSGLDHRQVVATKTRDRHAASGLRKSHDGGELETRLARCGDAQHAVREMQAVADKCLALQQAAHSEVLSQKTGRQVFVKQAHAALAPLVLPERVVLGWVGVDGLVQPAVNAQVGLLVAGQSQSTHRHGAGHRLLANAGQYASPADADRPQRTKIEAFDAKRCGHGAGRLKAPTSPTRAGAPPIRFGRPPAARAPNRLCGLW